MFLNRRQFLGSASLGAATTLLPRSSVRAASNSQAAKLHLLLAVDTNAENIGSNMAANLAAFEEVFSEIWNGKQDRFTYTVLRGRDVNPNTILRAYQGNSLGESESLFFYYCGHGGWDNRANGIDGNEVGHFLAMSGGRLDRSRLRQSMLDRNPYGAFILTDCCSNIAGVEPPRRNVPAAWKGFQNLFFDSRGLTDIQAATRGQFGWSNGHGGFFTRAFLKLLCEPRSTFRDDDEDGFVSWKDFHRKLRSDTIGLFNQAQAGASRRTDGIPDILDYQPQDPEAFYLSEWPERERYLKIANRTGERFCIVLHYRAFVPGKGWGWYGGKQYEFNPGEESYLGDNWRVRASMIRYRAWTPTRKWNHMNDDQRIVTFDGYRKGEDMGTYTLSFS